MRYLHSYENAINAILMQLSLYNASVGYLLKIQSNNGVTPEKEYKKMFKGTKPEKVHYSLLPEL